MRLAIVAACAVVVLAGVGAMSAVAAPHSVTVQASSNQWTDTGYNVPAAGIVVHVSGDATCHAGGASDCPIGQNGSSTCNNTPNGAFPPGPAGENVPYGALAGRFGSGPAFEVSDGQKLPTGNDLQLVYNDCQPDPSSGYPGYSDNAGSFTVQWKDPVTLSGRLTEQNCSEASCSQTGVGDVTVAVNGSGGSYTSTPSDASGNWSLDVPPDTYTIAPDPSAGPWTPESLPATDYENDTGGLDFARCAQPTHTAFSGRHARIVAAAAHHCTKTVVRCFKEGVSITSQTSVSGSCVVTVTDTTTHPTTPTGTVRIVLSGDTPEIFSHYYHSFPNTLTDERYCALHGNGAKAGCVFSWGSGGNTDTVALHANMNPTAAKASYPGDGVHNASVSQPVSPIDLAEVPPGYWSTPGGQKVLKYWGLAESGTAAFGAILTGAAKIDSIPKGPGLKFIAANPELSLAIAGGLALGMVADNVIAEVDPPDSHYTAVAVPRPPKTPHLGNSGRGDTRLLRGYVHNMLLMAAVARALHTTIDRASTAKAKHDQRSHARQIVAARRYFRELARLTDKQVAFQQRIARLLRTRLRKAHAGDVVTIRAVPTTRQAKLTNTPQIRKVIRLLRELGAPRGYINYYRSDQNFFAHMLPVTFNLPAVVSNPTFVKLGHHVAAVLRSDARRIH